MEQSLDYSLTMSGELPDTSKLGGIPPGNPETPLSKTAPTGTPSTKGSASKFLQMAAASFDEDYNEGSSSISPGGGGGSTPSSLKQAASVVDKETKARTPRGNDGETKRAMMLAAGRVEREEHREVAIGLKRVVTTPSSVSSSSKKRVTPKQSATSPVRGGDRQNRAPNSQSLVKPKASQNGAPRQKKVSSSANTPFTNLRSSGEFAKLSKSQQITLSMSRVMGGEEKVRKSKDKKKAKSKSLRDSWERLSQAPEKLKSTELGNYDDRKHCTFVPKIKKWKGGEQKEEVRLASHSERTSCTPTYSFLLLASLATWRLRMRTKRPRRKILRKSSWLL